jgi:hypothetical protein
MIKSERSAELRNNNCNKTAVKKISVVERRAVRPAVRMATVGPKAACPSLPRGFPPSPANSRARRPLPAALASPPLQRVRKSVLLTMVEAALSIAAHFSEVAAHHGPSDFFRRLPASFFLHPLYHPLYSYTSHLRLYTVTSRQSHANTWFSWLLPGKS